MGLKYVAKTSLTLRKNHNTTLNFMDFTKYFFFFLIFYLSKFSKGYFSAFPWLSKRVIFVCSVKKNPL